MKKSSKDYEKKARRMATPTRMHLVDLNLFRVFDTLMLHRNVRKTSELLMVTPSAVSHALNRLRDAIGDPLFTPSRHGMEPTQHALELASAVRKGLENFEVAFSANRLCRRRLSGLFASPRAILLPWWSYRSLLNGWLRAHRILTSEYFRWVGSIL